MKVYHIDTNLILRFLTGTPKAQAQLAANLLKKGEDGEFQIQISSMIVAEAVFVLTGSVYPCPRPEVADQLKQFLSNPSFHVEELDTVMRALDLFKTHKIDFADAYLAAKAILSNSCIASFDQDFTKIKNVDVNFLKVR